MPTILKIRGYRFFFYSNEGLEPCHVHIAGYGGETKFWIPSCEVVWSYNFNAKQLREIMEIIKENLNTIEEKWYEHFNR